MTRKISRMSLARLACSSIVVFTAVWPTGIVAGAAPTPDLSGEWGRNSLGYLPPESGPGPIVSITHDTNNEIGDLTNPILKPAARNLLEKNMDMRRNGINYPTPSNQCWPWMPPYILRSRHMEIFQENNQVTFVFLLDHQIRRVRLNQQHPKSVTPSWLGDSVGHYEGDTLVVDTIGIKVAPISIIDIFGTPHSEALHVVERYRLIDGEKAKLAAEREEITSGRQSPDLSRIDRGYTGKGLEVQFTVEDPGVFTTPWSASVAYRRAAEEWSESVCAENPHDYFTGQDTPVPRADRPDF